MPKHDPSAHLRVPNYPQPMPAESTLAPVAPAGNDAVVPGHGCHFARGPASRRLSSAAIMSPGRARNLRRRPGPRLIALALPLAALSVTTSTPGVRAPATGDVAAAHATPTAGARSASPYGQPQPFGLEVDLGPAAAICPLPAPTPTGCSDRAAARDGRGTGGRGTGERGTGGRGAGGRGTQDQGARPGREAKRAAWPARGARPRVPRLTRPGIVDAFGDARQLGGPTGRYLAGVADDGGHGYWAATTGGAVYAYGTSRSYGSLYPHPVSGGVVAIAATPDGHGYWLASGGGGVFAFGDAGSYGSLGGRRLASPVVGMAASRDGRGYLLVTASGRVYSFGDAHYFGGVDARDDLSTPVIGIASVPAGNGYWLATAGGRVLNFGAARAFRGLSTKERSQGTRLAAIASDPVAQGYWLLRTDGAIYRFGSAPYLGRGFASSKAAAHVIAPTADGHGYLIGATITPRTSPGQRATVLATEAPAAPARTYLGVFMVTCYDLTGETASGAMAGPESVAVDPNVIPFGTELYIDGVGTRTADDTGGAIIGDHLDIWEPSYDECIDWGVRYRSVYRVDPQS